MKLKFLLFHLLLAILVNAQEPYRSLVITEARLDNRPNAYLEITNMGDKTVDLSEFKLGLVRFNVDPPIFDVWNDPWVPAADMYFMLPAKNLEPGESFVITSAWDYGPYQYKNRAAGYNLSENERPKQVEIYDVADMLIHMREAPFEDPRDSVTIDPPFGENYQRLFFVITGGRDCLYLEHHFAEGDSAVVDQVGGVFDENGRVLNSSKAVAGVEGATSNSVLVRRFSVKQGNPDFGNARGVGLEDSEWMPVQRPGGYNAWRDLWWTVGNHGPYALDGNTLESDVVDVDFVNKTLTVPWGTRRLDGIMRHMVKKPGILWNYHLNPNYADSLYRSARTGDKFIVYVCGNELQTDTFDIVVSEPDADANIVIPIDHPNTQPGRITGRTQNGLLTWPRVTQHESGPDTITGFWHGLGHSFRTDSLLKYLEKPANATWEFVWVDGIPRPDLKNGDKLKVTAQSGAVKEYFIQVQPYESGHNGYLSAITWPDIPPTYKSIAQILGWKGDTIPNFNRTTYNYKIELPANVEGVPALVAKTEDLNAKVEVKRAKSLTGTPEDRTVSFIVTAEDDSVTYTYNVELIKAKDPDKQQPFYAEPFLSEFVFWDQWLNNYAEICNPGNQPLDLSKYMIAMAYTSDPASVITSTMGVDEWMSRFNKYVPGYKWVDEAQWAVTPGILVPDLNVNHIVQPGDVFCFGHMLGDAEAQGYNWHVPEQLDVQFNNLTNYPNPWNEPVGVEASPVGKWSTANWFMFEILNDSITRGLKPANDPNDFKLIEYYGNEAGGNWVVGGTPAQMIMNWMRKPDIYQPNAAPGASFGTTPDDSEWTWTNQAYWQARGAGWPWRILNVGLDIGQHFMYEPTHYKSTVTSAIYKVSEGYSHNEEIWGIIGGTVVSDFLSGIDKADENQTLTLKATADGSVLGNDAVLSMNDTLVVVSADGKNTTKYILDVGDGLSSDAVLTSAIYQITIVSEPKSASESATAGEGIITGFDYGTMLGTIISNVNVPSGALMNVIDGQGAYVSLRKLNFDTTYVNVTVNADTYFEVLAEDGITSIIYHLQPNTSVNDAFILSDVYQVSQMENLISFIPRGTSVQSFFLNITTSLGSTAILVDKMGHKRTDGLVKEDDKVVVTSSNGLVTKVYHLSMLRTQLLPDEGTYLAYVLSQIYQVDQISYRIAGVSEGTQMDVFYSNVHPVEGASVAVVDELGNEKTSGDVSNTDMLKVTSFDGKIVVHYNIDLSTSAYRIDAPRIEVYPNPTSGKLYVNGLDRGYRIQVFNSTGGVVYDIRVQNSVETISLDKQPSGLYLIAVSDNSRLLGHYKAIKK